MRQDGGELIGGGSQGVRAVGALVGGHRPSVDVEGPPAPPVAGALAVSLPEALVGLDECDFVIVDGPLIPTGRIKADEPYHSHKHRKHGMNVQVVAAPDGTPLWFSRALPGRTHDLTAARAHGIVQACLTREVLVLADRAYRGAGATFRTPYYNHHELPDHYQQYNRDHARLRAPGERAFAQLKAWKVFSRARCSTNRISRLIAVVRTLMIHTLLTCKNSG
ncbi:putative transposase [Kitasatospora setae KM-6054]|uniref:Putative transposase n=1 Tax=Kitasatospora setae (strain ATCC 33774 / DSM 43861 / JCM 3304 / KCC A-0304 / NBRC 14216 / KM-6054) TaxID=452652 RepID=E4NA35_KITSK|nr:putative transposase [Kitasatospora setae KM-6054]